MYRCSIHIHTVKQWHIEVRALALLPLVKILKNQSYSLFPQWIWHRADFSEFAAAVGLRTGALLSMVKFSKRLLATQCTVCGWKRPIDCRKVQVSFRKRAINRRALSQKMTYKDKASYESLPPARFLRYCIQ